MVTCAGLERGVKGLRDPSLLSRTDLKGPPAAHASLPAGPGGPILISV